MQREVNLKASLMSVILVFILHITSACLYAEEPSRRGNLGKFWAHTEMSVVVAKFKKVTSESNTSKTYEMELVCDARGKLPENAPFSLTGHSGATSHLDRNIPNLSKGDNV